MSYASGSSRNKWSSRFPVYQIDFTAVASGKRVATSKRRIRWRFGFSNQAALDAGESGTACRGEEHDVTVVWSVTSGKRLILADGQEVHYSTTRSGVFEFSWTMRGNHVLKVVAHAAPQMTGNPNFRQYDLSVDGQSFFVMPKVYELGIRGPISAHAPVPGVNSSSSRSLYPPSSSRSQGYSETRSQYSNYAPSDRDQEEDDLKRAILNSIEESRAHLKRTTEGSGSSTRLSVAPKDIAPEAPPVPAPAQEADLLDMSNMTISVPRQQTPAPAPVPTKPAPTYGGGQAYNQNQMQVTTSAPPPSFSDIYMSTQPQGVIQGNTYANSQTSAIQHAAPAQIAPVNNSYHNSQLALDPMKKLVNIDDINSPVGNQSNLVKVFADEKNNQAAAGRALEGPQPSLSEMRLAKPSGYGNKPEVMKSYGAPNGNNNALVVSTTQSGYANQNLAYSAGSQMQPSYGYNQTQGYGSYPAQPSGYGNQYNQHMIQQQYQQNGGYSKQQQPPQPR